MHEERLLEPVRKGVALDAPHDYCGAPDLFFVLELDESTPLRCNVGSAHHLLDACGVEALSEGITCPSADAAISVPSSPWDPFHSACAMTWEREGGDNGQGARQGSARFRDTSQVNKQRAHTTPDPILKVISFIAFGGVCVCICKELAGRRCELRLGNAPKNQETFEELRPAPRKSSMMDCGATLYFFVYCVV